MRRWKAKPFGLERHGAPPGALRAVLDHLAEALCVCEAGGLSWAKGQTLR